MWHLTLPDRDPQDQTDKASSGGYLLLEKENTAH